MGGGSQAWPSKVFVYLGFGRKQEIAQFEDVELATFGRMWGDLKINVYLA